MGAAERGRRITAINLDGCSIRTHALLMFYLAHYLRLLPVPASRISTLRRGYARPTLSNVPPETLHCTAPARHACCPFKWSLSVCASATALKDALSTPYRHIT